MAKRSSKSKWAREQALQARAEDIARQQTMITATEDGFLALDEFSAVAGKLAAAFQVLLDLGESKSKVAETYGLETAHVTAIFKFAEQDNEESDENTENDSAAAGGATTDDTDNQEPAGDTEEDAEDEPDAPAATGRIASAR